MKLAPLDYVIAALFSVAVLRGMTRGLLRESFSIASLAAAVLVVRFFYAPVAEWLIAQTNGDISPEAAPWVAGVLLIVVAIGATTAIGRFLRRGAKAAGLGWADRAGGLAVGAVEGVLICAIVIGVIGYVVGSDHQLLIESKGVQTLDELEHFAKTGELPEGFELPDVPMLELPEVAAPPPDSLDQLEEMATDLDIESPDLSEFDPLGG
jgi:membrane protein required for colicin V production